MKIRSIQKKGCLFLLIRHSLFKVASGFVSKETKGNNYILSYFHLYFLTK